MQDLETTETAATAPEAETTAPPADPAGLDDVAIATLDAEIELSNALWVDEIEREAAWPDREAAASSDAWHARKARFDEYLTGRESRQIARILFQLKAYGIDTVAAMEGLIARHNAAIEHDLANPDYVRATGTNPERLRAAIFASESEKEVLLNAVARFGPGVLHKSAYGRLLVRHANVNRVNASLDVLRDAGFLTVRKGANNADIILSDGRLEAAHRAYVQRIIAVMPGRPAP
ncbi:MAG: hypothetical protein AAFR52_00370 [Pseudomonadota bacterium]